MGQITRPAFRVLGVFFPTLGRVSADFRLQLFQPFTLTANFAISVAVVNFGEFLAQQSRQSDLYAGRPKRNRNLQHPRGA